MSITVTCTKQAKESYKEYRDVYGTKALCADILNTGLRYSLLMQQLTKDVAGTKCNFNVKIQAITYVTAVSLAAFEC